MKIHIVLALFVALVIAQTPVRSEPKVASVGDFQGQVTPKLEPHGDQVCASGCALSRHPTPKLEADKFHELIRAYAREPMSDKSEALEELLFYGPQSRGYLSKLPEEALDPQRLAFLTRELKRNQVVIEFRILDDQNQVRVGLPPTTVRLDRRYVFEPLNTHDFQPPEASGTVKRVGLNHLWQRI